LEIKEENPDFPTLGGMNGLLDQLFALTWINNNIEAFGGNPSLITIMGESAGGLSVCMLAASPLSAGLFSNILIQSGSCTGPWGPSESTYGLVYGQLFLESLNCSNLDDLRDLPLSTLMASPYWDIFPSVDDHFLPMSPLDIYALGNSQIPVNGHIMISTNTLDTLFGFPFYNGPFPEDNQELLDVISEYFGADDANKIFQIYPGSPSPKIAFQRIITHLCLSCPTSTLVYNLLEDSYTAIYVYEYGYNPAIPHFAGHGADIPMVFGYPFYVWPFNITLSNVMIDYLSSFMTKGVPESRGNVPWPVFEENNESMYFDTTVITIPKMNAVECGFWKEYASQTPANVLKMYKYCYQNPLFRK